MATVGRRCLVERQSIDVFLSYLAAQQKHRGLPEYLLPPVAAGVSFPRSQVYVQSQYIAASQILSSVTAISDDATHSFSRARTRLNGLTCM